MWDTAGLPSSLLDGPTDLHGCPTFAPASPGFPTTQHWPRPRMRLSLKERRMKLLNATNLDRKSGIRGPKTMGEALRQPFYRTQPVVHLWMTISRRVLALDCRGALSLEGSIGGFALAPVSLSKKAVGLDERGVSLSSSVEL
jgi:hypothetical protein